jgi:prepilin-type processing-associated H-X9-DG protein
VQTNYKGVSGSNWGADGSLGLGPGQLGSDFVHRGANGSYDGLDEGDGMLFRSDYRLKRTAAHVLDGLSNTFMLGEDVPEENTFCSWSYSNNAYRTCGIPPNYSGGSGPGDWRNRFSFRSWHPGGLHFAFGDGAVKYVRDDVSLDIYRAAATIRGSEALPQP